MNPAELYADLMDVPARVGTVVHLRTAIVDGRRSDAVEELLEDIDDDKLVALWPNMPAEAREAFSDLEWDEMEAWIDDLKLFGFLVQVETPIVNKNGGYSWGYYTHKLFYAATFDEAITAGLTWATAEHEKRSSK